MFFHVENQQILWRAIQKSPYLVEFSQKYSGHRDTWFQGISEQFYSQWISQNGRVPSNAKELLEMNKRALEYFVLDLKRLLGYKTTSPISDPLSSYNVAKEKQEREEKNATKFSSYQEEYSRLLQRPALPQNVFPSESAANQKIKNMDELLAEQAKLREMDLTAFLPPNASNESSPIIRHDIGSPSGIRETSRLKIFDAIDRVDDLISLEIKEIDTQSQHKSVSWSNAIEESL
jgi:hypothetical protein